MRISKSNKSKVDASTETVCASSKQKVVYDKDGIKVTEFVCSPNYYIDSEDCLAIIENNTDKEYYVCGSGFDDFYVPAHGSVEVHGDEDGYATVNYFKWKDVPALTKEQVKDLWDKRALFIDWGDGSDSLCQENGYTLDEILDAMDQGGEVYIDEDPTEIHACGEVKTSTSTDKALQHIKAAIDILGKSGDKDEVTKDTIANLGVVMFDLIGKK